MIDDKLRRAAPPIFALFFFLGAATANARAQNGDDFEKLVHHIESRYHAHRNFGFLMGVAGFAAKAWHTSGVKDVKIALFEDQQVLRSVSDREMDELIDEGADSGWRPIVKSASRRSGHVYIYARTEGRDLKMLVVNVEPNEAEVVEVKLDPRKLEEFVNQHCRRDSKPSRELAFN